MQYGVNDVDENGAVKPGLGLYLISIFLCRQLFYAPLSMLASRRGRGGGGGPQTELDLSFLVVTSVWEFVACLPAAFMLFLLVKDRAELGATLRGAWLRGRWVLLAGIALQVVVQAWYYLGHGNGPSLIGLALAVGYLYCASFLLTKQRVKDTFSRVPV